MAIRPDYVTGTITLTSGSTSFTTSGSALQAAAVQTGDEIITRSGNVLIIESITGQNSGTLMQPCPASAAGAAQPLRIRYQPDGSRYQGAMRDIISRWGDSGNVDALAALIGAAGKLPIFTGPGTMDLVDKSDVGIEDPNGTLGELANLDSVENLGELAKLVLAANKMLTTDDNGKLTQSDITAAARVLLKLAGSAAADRLPYFTGEDGAGLTPLTAFARSILDDANGAAMWSTMGGDQSLTSNGWCKLPGGIIIQWGAYWSGGGPTVTFPMQFPNACYIVLGSKSQSAMAPDNVYDNWQIASYSTASAFVDGRRITAGSVVKANVTGAWVAIGR